MKLLLMGCLHGSAPKTIIEAVKIYSPDAILCCGDLCNADDLRDLEFGVWQKPSVIKALFDDAAHRNMIKRSADSMQIPIKFLSSLRVPVLLVYGNNDFLDADLKKMRINSRGLESRLPKNIRLLKDEVFKIGDAYVAGFPGYRSSLEKLGGGQRVEKRISRILSKIKDPESTIFLTHDVPYKKFDLVTWEKSPAYGRHVGEKSFNAMLRKTRFLAFVCAHMHEHQGSDKLFGTLIINTGYGKAGRAVLLDTKSMKTRMIR